MTVEAIRLRNFMAFEDSGWIELRPVTLLFGRNSSGKSTIIRALRLLRQSLDVSRNHSTFLFSSPYGINFGPYKETVHRSLDPGNGQRDNQLPRMAFGFRCGLPTTLDIFWSLLEHQMVTRGEEIPARDYLPKVVEVELTFEAARNGEQARLSEVTVTFATASNGVARAYNIFSALRLGNDDADAFGEEWWFASDILANETEAGKNLWRGWGIETKNDFLPQLVQVVRQVGNGRQPEHNVVDGLLQDVRNEVTGLLHQLVHLGPIRPEPRRAYALSRADLDTLANAGWRGLVRLLTEDLDENDVRRIEAWLCDAEFASELLPDRLSTAMDVGVLTQIILRDMSKLEVNLADVGYGTSQVIPVLLECFTAESGDLVVIEQPELHLHPRAQAKIGDVFIAMSQRGVRFLIETHSEHLLLRLQKQIAKTTVGEIEIQSPEQMLLPNQVAVYFVRRKESSTVSKIEIGPYGDLLNTPDGFEEFFSDDMLETAERMRIRLGRRRSKS